MRIKISWCSSIWRFDGAKIVYWGKDGQFVFCLCGRLIWFFQVNSIVHRTLYCAQAGEMLFTCVLQILLTQQNLSLTTVTGIPMKGETNICHRESQIVNVLGRRRFTFECELWCWHCSSGRCSSEFKWTGTIEILATDEKPTGNDRVEVERLFLRCRK